MTVRMLLDELPPSFLRILAVVHGLLWGSFLNVVIYRVPRGLNVAYPASRCPTCETPIRPWNNVPVVSWVLMRGRSRCCKTPVSPRYVVVELLGGLLSLAVVETQILPYAGTLGVGRAAAIYGADFALALGLTAAAFIDLSHMILPDAITLGGLVLGVATTSSAGARSEMVGAARFFGVWVPFGLLYKKLTGRTGMGLGDAKLLGLAGAWFGWAGAVVALFGGALLGALAAALLAVFRVKLGLPEAVREELEELRKAAEEGDEEAKQILAEDPLAEDAPGEARARLPFGPFLVLACLALLFAEERVLGVLAPLVDPGAD